MMEEVVAEELRSNWIRGQIDYYYYLTGEVANLEEVAMKEAYQAVRLEAYSNYYRLRVVV